MAWTNDVLNTPRHEMGYPWTRTGRVLQICQGRGSEFASAPLSCLRMEALALAVQQLRSPVAAIPAETLSTLPQDHVTVDCANHDTIGSIANAACGHDFPAGTPAAITAAFDIYFKIEVRDDLILIPIIVV